MRYDGSLPGFSLGMISTFFHWGGILLSWMDLLKMVAMYVFVW